MNKYESLARESRRDRIKDRSCSRKKKFPSREQALAHNKNQTAYLCDFCHQWHLSGDLVQQLKISKAVSFQIKSHKRAFNEQ